MPGKSEAVCPSLPRPSNTRSNRGHSVPEKNEPQFLFIETRIGGGITDSVNRVHVVWRYRHVRDQRLVGQAIVAFRMIGRNRAFVAEKDMNSDHSMRVLNGSVASSSYIRRGVFPPDKATLNNSWSLIDSCGMLDKSFSRSNRKLFRRFENENFWLKF